MEDNFSKARLESSITQKYNIKTAKNNNKKFFIEEYYKNNGELTDTLKEQARDYTLIERGILPNDAIKEYYPVPITKELVSEIYKKIKLNSKENYVYFYESWRRKVDQGYYQEKIDSSLEDLKTALFIYRKCNNPNWNVPIQMVAEGELKNLYLLLSNTKLNAGEINISNISKIEEER